MKRKEHLALYIKYLDFEEQMKDDPKLTMPPELEAGKEAYEALNTTLKEELPVLYAKTDEIMKVLPPKCIMIQGDWHKLWVERFVGLLDLPNDITFQGLLEYLEVDNIIQSFHSDFHPAYAETQELSICNGALRQNITNYLSPMPDEGSTHARPSTQASRSETNLSSPNVSRRHSGQAPFVPALGTNFGLHPEGSIAETNPGRMRYNSEGLPAEGHVAETASGRVRNNSHGTSLAPAGPSTRPSTANQQSRPPSEDFRTQSQRRIFNSAVPMDLITDPTNRNSNDDDDDDEDSVMFIAASLFEFSINPARTEAGYPYLAYQPGEIFNVYGTRGELWLARNQDDSNDTVGWIWERHFARILDA